MCNVFNIKYTQKPFTDKKQFFFMLDFRIFAESFRFYPQVAKTLSTFCTSGLNIETASETETGVL